MRQGAILCFHSITTPARDAHGTAHVSADGFRRLVMTARQLGEIVPLSELLSRHAEGRGTAGLVSLTFDDAYAALAEVRDFLSRHAVPIAIFPVIAAASTAASFWWDRIDDVFPRVSPEGWRRFETACGVPDEYREGQPREHGPLRPLRQWLLAAYAGRWPDELEAALRMLEGEAGYQTVHRAMSCDEIATLSSACDVEIGVHTLSHPVLPLLGDDELHDEIAAAHQTLRDRFEKVLPVLAVPFGLYDPRTIGIARAAGMSASLTLAGGLDQSTEADAVPRVCMTSGSTCAGLALRLLGVPAMVRRWTRRGGAMSYPPLPSPTT
ncbi:MAG TPA: polysaccharide deacetylase family protein [Vicinamibacterales bacterium]|nr:polysaccharide deacetylase family protein [Vicinamibacterales bacterium]